MAFRTARRPLRADKGAVVSTIGGCFAPEQCRRKDHHPPMSNYPVGRRPRSADPHSMVLLAAAAFVLSYPGIHAVALQAGVSPNLAKLYPVIFDAMLVVAGAAAIALRGAGWWSRFYAWACLIVLLAAVAIGDAVHATGTALPDRATRAAVAVTPWVLLLLAFGLLLTMLGHFR